jgi:hypothetical protein
MHNFDEAMAQTLPTNENDNYAPTTWKVGEILMAAHESLTMSSGFNDRPYTAVSAVLALTTSRLLYIHVYIFIGINI